VSVKEGMKKIWQKSTMINTQIHGPTNTALYRRQIVLQRPEFDGRLTNRSREDANGISSEGID